MVYPTGGNEFGIGLVFQRGPIFARGARYLVTRCLETMEMIDSDNVMDVHMADRFLLFHPPTQRKAKDRKSLVKDGAGGRASLRGQHTSGLAPGFAL